SWSVVDLFSGAGGMSYGFHAHPGFQVIGAVDAQLGKPSSGRGTLGCNVSYLANIGLDPLEADLGTSDPAQLCEALGVGPGQVTVLAACPPCTGFTRTMARNHLRDDLRNSLVRRVSQFARVLRPDI